MAAVVLILVLVLLVTILLAATSPARADHAGLRFREGQPVSPAEDEQPHEELPKAV
jgi:hypothetical protein